jgi:hypothetical protein
MNLFQCMEKFRLLLIPIQKLIRRYKGWNLLLQKLPVLPAV